MSETKWTEGQLKAIDHRGSSMIVSAAAGSGKTAVLVERVIRLMDTTDIDKMLVVTFTNAAAASMKQRIHSAILKRLENPSADTDTEYFSRQLSLLHTANINTLHAFCSRFVREHFNALGLSPSVKLGDTTQLNLMLSDAVDKAINEKYEEQDPDFLTFASEIVAKTKDSVISDIVLSIYKFSMSLPNPEKWLLNAADVYENKDADKFLAASSFINDLKLQTLTIKNIADFNLEKAKEKEEYSYALSHFEADKEFADRLYAVAENNSFYLLEKEIDNLPKRPAVRLKNKNVDVAVSDYLGLLRGEYKAALDALVNSVRECSSITIAEMMALQKPRIRAIVSLTLRAMELYNQDKKEKELLDFNDLEHKTIELLYENDEISELAKEISNEFECIIVDEYQDINPVQEAIITALSKEGTNLFMVGDVKQGIYGFRNTVPKLFTDKVDLYNSTDSGECVYLSDNFRSRKSVLEFANHIFSQLMTPLMGGTPYTEKEALHHKASFPECDESAEVYVIDDERFSDDTITAEAIFCANKIHEMIEGKAQVKGNNGELRDIKYGDIAILLRATKNVATPFCDTLSRLGIPVYCDSIGESFLETTEIQTLLSFLKAFDNPLRDIDLLSAFTSPIFGEPDYDLAVRTRLMHKKSPLYICFKEYPEDLEGYERIKEFLEFIEFWRKKAMHLPIDSFLSLFLAETGFDEFMQALKGGEQRLSNIRYLQSLSASNFPGKETGGLYSFLDYLEKHSKTKEGLSSPKTLPENADLVQVTTIHKSKGLEYPVVFLARAGTEFNKKGDNNINFHRDFGIAMSYQNVEKSLKLPSPMFKIIRETKQKEELSEELRILYVALTRAIDKTIVVGYSKNSERLTEYASLAEKGEEISISPKTVAAGKSYLEWILCALQRKQMWRNLPFSLSFVNRLEIPEIESKEEVLLTAKEPSEQLKERMEYLYPYKEHTKVFSKVSVTELKRMSQETDDNSYMPYLTLSKKVSFDDDKTSLKKGTVTHFILENLDFSENDAMITINKLVSDGRLTAQEASLADVESLNLFLKSNVCKSLQKADEIYKELPFNIFIDGAVLNENAKGEKIQLQGTIDCIAKIRDVLYIIDFKTDKITKTNLAEKIEAYRNQLLYYREGAKKLFPGMKIKGYLYFLSANREVEIF